MNTTRQCFSSFSRCLSGFSLYKNFLPSSEYEGVVLSTHNLMEAVRKAPRENKRKFHSRFFGNPEGFFYDTCLTDENGKEIQFRDYTGCLLKKNRELFHFSDKIHVPYFLQDTLIPRIRSLAEVKSLGLDNYNVSMNLYEKGAVFPYHQDTAKERMTIIYSVRPYGAKTADAMIFFKKKGADESFDVFEIPDNCLSIITGEAYDNFEHMVTNQDERVSFAFGRMRSKTS
ncbi:MAG: hypothetical protein ChlgKO_05710 [Chlamydiales bacterium]